MQKRKENQDVEEGRGWVMHCVILLVLHVSVSSGVCYKMAVNLILSCLAVDSSRRSREGRREAVDRVSFCVCVCVLVIELSMLMHYRGWGATWNMSYVVLLIKLYCVHFWVVPVVWCFFLVNVLMHGIYFALLFCRSQNPIEISRWGGLFVTFMPHVCICNA